VREGAYGQLGGLIGLTECGVPGLPGTRSAAITGVPFGLLWHWDNADFRMAVSGVLHRAVRQVEIVDAWLSLVGDGMKAGWIASAGGLRCGCGRSRLLSPVWSEWLSRVGCTPCKGLLGGRVVKAKG